MSGVEVRIDLHSDTISGWSPDLYEGRFGRVSDAPLVGAAVSPALGFYDGSAWEYTAMRGGTEAFSNIVLTNPVFTAHVLPKISAFAGALEPSCFSDDGTNAACSLPFLAIAGAKAYSSEIIPSLSYSTTPDTTVANTTTETSLLNGATSGYTAASVDAGRWNVVGARSRIEAMGRISSAAGQGITLRVKRNGTTVASAAISGQNFGTNTIWRLMLEPVTTTAGASGEVRYIGRVYYTAGNANGAVSAQEIFADVTGLDLTAASTWDITAQWGAANASNSITAQSVERVG